MSEQTAGLRPAMSEQSGSYSAYLGSGWWLQRRRRFLSRARNRACAACGKLGGLLEIHHRTYARLWREISADLAALCADCHREVHVREVLLRATAPALSYADRLRRATMTVIVGGRAHRDGFGS